MPIPTALLMPITIDGLALRNRVVMAPMTRGRAGPTRVPNELMAEYYSQRASAGLIVTEATTVSPAANGWVDSPGLYTADMESGWRRVVDAVHHRGGSVVVQLWHCGRASHSTFQPDCRPPAAPSEVAISGDGIHTPAGKRPYEVPRAITPAEIVATLEAYRQAAERARRAGFDGVEVHAANGYLIDTFLQSRTNRRTDGYGGSLDNRFRFLGQVLDRVLSVWPSCRVGVRLSPNGVSNDMGSPDFRETFLAVAERLDARVIGYLHVMDGLAFGFHGLGEPLSLTDFRRVFRGRLIGNCGYDRETADAAVAAGHADLIAFGRPYLSNPDLVERFAADRPLAGPAPEAVWYTPGAAGYTDFPPAGG